MTWAAEPPGQWGRVPIIFWEILCYFQKYKAKVSTTNGSKVTMIFDFCKVLLTLAMNIFSLFFERKKWHYNNFITLLSKITFVKKIINYLKMKEICEKIFKIIISKVLF